MAAPARPPVPADTRAAPRPRAQPGGVWPTLRDAAVRFYDDQMTQHAGALTYYALMSLFPSLLLALSLLGLVGEYPRTYNSIVDWLTDVAPASIVDPLDSALRHALERKGTAATTFALSVPLALYGTTGVLESARRALNVVFDVECGRGFLRRKSVDIVSTLVLMVLVLATLLSVFVGGRLAEQLLGADGARAWSLLRWPVALLAATQVFAWLYFVTADRAHRRFRAWPTPGALVGVVLWVAVSAAFGEYASGIGSLYGAFTGPIALVAWLWLTGVALLFGAQIDAATERRRRAASGGWRPPDNG